MNDKVNSQLKTVVTQLTSLERLQAELRRTAAWGMIIFAATSLVVGGVVSQQTNLMDSLPPALILGGAGVALLLKEKFGYPLFVVISSLLVFLGPLAYSTNGALSLITVPVYLVLPLIVIGGRVGDIIALAYFLLAAMAPLYAPTIDSAIWIRSVLTIMITGLVIRGLMVKIVDFVRSTDEKREREFLALERVSDALVQAKISLEWIDCKTGQILSSNDYAKVLHGDRKIAGVPLWELDKNVTPKNFSIWVSIVRNKGSHSHIFRSINQDGTPIYVQVDALWQAASANIPEQLLVFKRDVSEVLENQSRLEETLAELRQVQAKQKQTYGIIAHELRTPVAAIEMMAKHTPDDWAQDQVTVRTVVNDLLHTIDDMKMLVNPELKREKYFEKTTVELLNASISSMVASTVATTGVLYQQMTLVLDDLLEQDLVTDSYRVKAAVTNLVRNACLHSEGSRVWCLTGISLDASGRQFIRWTVSDDGKGISDQQLAELFKPFARGDSKAEGTGLGLHITKSWIEEIGGSVSYRRLDKGSEFSVLVPFDHTESDLAESESESESDLNHVRAIASQLRVLLVEDDKVLQMVTSKMLGELFKSVELATDGREGLSKSSENFDLILTDYFMPNMTGVEMIAQLRETGYTQPIIGATAATISGQVDEILSAGANQVLLKPINSDVVLGAIGALIDEGFYQDTEGEDTL